MPLDTDFDVVIFGAGPHGIVLGALASQNGLRHAVIDTAKICQLARDLPDELEFASDSKDILFEGIQTGPVNTRSFVEHYERYAKKMLVNVHENISYDYAYWDKHNKQYVISLYDQIIYAKAVVIATGAFSTPRKLGVPGESSDSVQYEIYNEDLKDKQVLVVGAGNAAANSILRASKSNHVIWAVRNKVDTSRIFAKWRSDLEALIKEDKITILEGYEVISLENNEAELKGEEIITMRYDLVSVNIGYTKDSKALDIFKVPMKDDSVIKDSYTCATEVPNLYVFGSLAEYCQVGGCHKIVTMMDAKPLGEQLIKDLIEKVFKD